MTVRPLFVSAGLAILSLNTAAFAQQSRTTLDGTWAGRTSQGKAITFRVEAGTMRALDLDWTMDFDRVCAGRTGSAPGPSRVDHGEMFFFHPQVRGSEPPQFRLPAFTLSRNVETPEASLTVSVSGSFASDSSVAGDLTLTATGCQGHETVTWKAVRK